MEEFRTTFDGLNWYYEPTTTKTAEPIIGVGDPEKYPSNISTVTINDHNVEKFDLYQDEMERLNNLIDALIKMIESQNKVIELLMKDKDHG